MTYEQCHLHAVPSRVAMMPRMRSLVPYVAALAASACLSDERFDFADGGPPVLSVGTPPTDRDAGQPLPDGGSALPDVGGPPDLGGPDAGDPLQTIVPAPLSTLSVTSRCTDLASGEQAVSASPEGYLWLVGDASGNGRPVRVLDGWDEGPPQSWSVGFTQLDHLRAESATVASVIADGGVWSLREGRRVSVAAPFTPGPDATTCGSLSENAFVLQDGRLFERTGTSWVEWTGLGSLLTVDTALVGRDGACRTGGDTLLLSTGSLEVWALTNTAATRTVAMTGASRVVLRDAQLLVLQNGELVYDPVNRGRWQLAAGPIDDLAAAGSYAWLRAGNELVRFDGSTFLSAGTLGPDAQLLPFAAGGVWAIEGGRACAITPESMIRVTGVTPGQTVTEAVVPLRARAADATEAVRLTVAGTEVAPIGNENGWLRFAPTLAAGWTTLNLSGDNGSVRSVELRLEGMLPPPALSWATDVQPVYAAHCAGSACHVADSTSGTTNLDSFANWVARSAAIQNRVVVTGDMPPSASRGPTWGPETVRTIADWIAGGMRP